MQSGRNKRSAKHRGRPAARPGWLPRALGIAGAALALAAVVLLVSYLIQGHKTRQEQAAQRALFRSQATENPADAAPAAQAAASLLPTCRLRIWQRASSRSSKTTAP